MAHMFRIATVISGSHMENKYLVNVFFSSWMLSTVVFKVVMRTKFLKQPQFLLHFWDTIISYLDPEGIPTHTHTHTNSRE